MKWVRKRVKMAPRSDREIRNIWTDSLKCCKMIQGIEDQKSDAGLPAEGFLYLDPASYQFRKERGIAMFGFLTFGTTLALTDLAVKKEIEARPDEEFPKTVKESGGLIRLYKNHNPGFSFGFMKEYPKLVEMVPVCMLSAVAGAWAYVIGKKGRVLEKTALTLVLAGGASNLYDRLKRGYVVDYFSIQWKKLKKVVFNLGDIFIFAGSALFAAVQLVEEIREILPKEKIFVKEEE